MRPFVPRNGLSCKELIFELECLMSRIVTGGSTHDKKAQ